MNETTVKLLATAALASTLTACGIIAVQTKKKIKNLDARLAARKELMDEMAAVRDPSIDQLKRWIRRGSEIDNMPI